MNSSLLQFLPNYKFHLFFSLYSFYANDCSAKKLITNVHIKLSTWRLKWNKRRKITGFNLAYCFDECLVWCSVNILIFYYLNFSWMLENITSKLNQREWDWQWSLFYGFLVFWGSLLSQKLEVCSNSLLFSSIYFT